MNWTRGINKLIILFLSINILLGWANYRKDKGAYMLRGSQLENITDVLEDNNIIVDSDIPAEHRPMKKLTVLPYEISSAEREDIVRGILDSLDGVKISIEEQDGEDAMPKRIYRKDYEYVAFDGETIIYSNNDIKDDFMNNKPLQEDTNIDKNDIDEAKEISKKWLSDMSINHRNKYVQVFEQDNGLINILYYDKYNGMPVFDSYIQFTLTPLGISGININTVELGESIGENNPIYSADQICFYLMQELTRSEPIHIKDIMVGYALENPEGKHLLAEEALPFYQITLEDGSFYYVNAYNSELREEPEL